MMETVPTKSFIEEIVDQDLRSGKRESIRTRFPPEPNGYLHIGHMKAVAVNFTIADNFSGVCNLRFDDTNPVKEDEEFVEAIQEDIRWMGFQWDKLLYASDYFEQMYDCAVGLIQKGKAYVCDLTAEQLRETRGTLTQPGTDSPWRNRSVEENLRLFAAMRAGEFPDGACTLRAKIDMASPNINMRDPALYRILHRAHHRTGDAWCIYPMYDYAHPLEDAIEGITHSLCSLEFEAHRPLYDWVVQECGFENPPQQIEFARLNLTNTIMSKRYLRKLVEEGLVSGWDDPRMPTIRGMRRRGYTPGAILDFLGRVGVAKADSVVDMQLLEHCVREDLGGTTPRFMAVLRPLKVTLTNWPEDKIEYLPLQNHPENEALGERVVPFGRHLYIEQDDFMENPPKKFFRLFPGGEVRLKGAYIIRCEEVIKDASGMPVEILCSVDETSKSGGAGAERKVKGTLHWVEQTHGMPIEVRLFDRMLNDAPEDGGSGDFMDNFNQASLEVLENAYAEPALGELPIGGCCQFMRMGYFSKDPDSQPAHAVFNRTVSLKDSWAKISRK